MIALNPAAQTLVGLDAKTAIPVVRQLPLWLQEFLQRFQFGVRFLPPPAAVLAAKKNAAYSSPVARGTGKEGRITKTRTKKSKARIAALAAGSTSAESAAFASCAAELLSAAAVVAPDTSASAASAASAAACTHEC